MDRANGKPNRPRHAAPSGRPRRYAALELALVCAWVFALCLVIAPGQSLGFMVRRPLLLALNLFPVAAVLLTVYFLTANSLVAGAVTELVFALMNYANLLKIEGRDDPFVPGDVALLREALQATGEYRLDLHLPLLALIVLTTAALFILGVRLGRPRRLGWPVRLVGAALAAALFAGACCTVYDDEKLYGSFPVSSPYNITTVFNELGFHYCFLYNMGLYEAERPENYSQAQAASWAEAPAEAAPAGEKPRILMVMCEAFSDLCADPVFTYPAEEHPLRDYYAVMNGGSCISGHIVVPNFGAGTANTEFDVLTGMQTNLINHTNVSALRSFFKNIPSLTRVLRDAGYGAFYMHPGQSWFYNRNSAMSRMGFDERIFVDDLPDPSIMDSVFLENLIGQLESRDGSLFAYATTIQNHQAYTYNKYDGEVPRVQVSVPLSEKTEERLSVYTYGVRCSSEMLLGLTEYLNGQDQPYILVFFGDHLPNLGADYQGYWELGLDIGADDTPEQTIAAFSAPYIIWANDAYLAGRSMESVAAGLDLPADGRISACFLGEVALEMAGLEQTDPYFRFLAQLRRTLPVIKNGIVGTPDGSLTTSVTAQQQEMIDKLHCWQYYRMTAQRVG